MGYQWDVPSSPPMSPMSEEGASEGFEGFEKRLEVDFGPDYATSDFDGIGLRALGRQELDFLLKAAHCTIVSQLSSPEMDSYVLSESSLFVYPLKLVIKTCGTTKLLNCVPVLLTLASSLGLAPRCVRYRRGTFLFPAAQPFPHGSFTDEADFLDGYFGLGRRYVLGDESVGHQWHVYMARPGSTSVSTSAATSGSYTEPSYTLEMCMTGLDKKVAARFFRANNETAEDMTEAAGIGGLLPRARICDYAFEPCGYSMNGVQGGAYSTIHVTPEEGFSYASFEAMGYGLNNDGVDLEALLHRVAACFKPKLFSVSVYSSGVKSESAGSWGRAPRCPSGYMCVGSSRQELPGGVDLVVYHTFVDISWENLQLYTPLKPASLFDSK